MDDFVLNVRQIGNYPEATSVGAADLLLLQQGGLGGPYVSMEAANLVGTALANGGNLQLQANSSITWNIAGITWNGSTINFTHQLFVPGINSIGDVFVGGVSVATQADIQAILDAPVVASVNGRSGNVWLQTSDILQAGAAPIRDAHFGGFNTSPTPWDFRANDDQIATTAWVQLVLTQLLCGGSVVTSFNGRGGPITLMTADVNAAFAVAGPPWPSVPSPPFGDASTRISSTLFVDEAVEDLKQWTIDYIAAGAGAELAGYAPLASPQFTGSPTAPTANPGSSTGQLATTAFVQAAVTAATTGVASFNTRTGAVVLTAADLNNVGGALLAGPAFTGTPTAPTAATATNTTQLATTAFVHAVTGAAVTSFNTRTGAISLTAADVTGVGGALLASPALTGTPTAPTAAVGTSSTQIATTAFVEAAMTGGTAGVASFMGRTGAVTLIANDVSAAGGALLAGPNFTGSPTTTTPIAGANGNEIANASWVNARLAAAPGGVSSFNGRIGAITLITGDITAAGGAPVAGPAFTGVPTAPTAAPGTNSTQVATCAFVASMAGVSSFNTRTGAIVLNSADITSAGGAPIAGPAFTGTPTAPTPAPTDSSTTLATTAYVTNKLASSAVTSFNGRTGAITFLAADVSAVGGALLASPAFTGTPVAPTPAPGDNTTNLATTGFVHAALAALPGGSPADAFRAHLSTEADGLAANTWYLVGFDTIDFDQNNKFTAAQYKWTPSQGKVQIAAQLYCTSSTGQATGIAIYKNGVLLKSGNAVSSGIPNIVVVDTANGTDYYQVYVSSTATFNLLAVATYAFFQGFAIAQQGPPGPPGSPMAIMPKQLSGLTLSNNATFATTLNIDTGVACSDDDTTMMVLSTAGFQKVLGIGWTAGSNNTGLDTGSPAANAWYHVFLIVRPDTGAVDILFSQSPTAPVMPVNYTKKRRIGSFGTDASSHIVAFNQVGDEFLLVTPTSIINNGGWSATASLLNIGTPPGVKTTAMFNCWLSGPTVNAFLNFWPPDATGEVTNNPPGNINVGTIANQYAGGQLRVRTNMAAQIYVGAVVGGSGSLYVVTHGWIDNRGK